MKKPRRIILDLSSYYSRNKYINTVIKVLLNISVMIILFRFTDVALYASTLSVVAYATLFTLIEELISGEVLKRFPQLVVTSFGILMIAFGVLSMTLAYSLVASEITFVTQNTFIGFTLIFMLVRKVISILLMSYVNRMRFERFYRKEIKKDV